MLKRKTKKEKLAEINRREIFGSKLKQIDINYRMCCGKTYCPFLESINNAFALGDIRLYQESSKLSDLVPGVIEHSEDIADIHHQIARAGLEGMGFSFNPDPQIDPLNDSGMHIVANPGFGYDN